jgi:putative endopeptidase
MTLRPNAALLLSALILAPLSHAGSFPDDVTALGYAASKMDTTVSPRQDFYGYAAGKWMKQTEIPASEPDVSGFSLLETNLDNKLLTIIHQAAAAPTGSASASRQQIGDFYRAAMDLPRLDARGLTPLADDLKRLEAADTPDRLAALSSRLQLGYGASPLINAGTGPDYKQSTVNVLYLVPGRQALTQDEYATVDGKRIRDLYLAFATRMFQSAGDTADVAAAHARTVLAIETELAAAQLTPLQTRDPKTTYNKLTLAEAQELIPGVDLRTFIAGLGVTPPDTVMVPDLQGLRATQKVLSQRPPTELRTLLRWHVLSAQASLLGQPWYGLDQDFTRQRKGLQTSESREREVTKAISILLFHPLSQLYVEAYFPESTKREITRMVAAVRDEFERRLRTNAWLDEPTRAAALEKLAKVDIAVGYPDKWIDFSGVAIRPDDYLGNVQRAAEFLLRREIAQLGKPVVIERFAVPGKTTPISVNAAYNPQYNNIDITAAIVQPPFYTPGADAAVNYCTVGAVIGHELTHGFDSFGRQFGPAGNLRDWWTPQAALEFKKRTDVLVEQYSQFQLLPGLMHNGTLTLTENTADLGGIALAHAALQRHLADHPLPKIDGMTSDQRCFVAWAQLWAYKARPERLRYLVANDYHAINSIRAIGPLLHLDAFYKAFDIQASDPMWRAPEKRITIW